MTRCMRSVLVLATVLFAVSAAAEPVRYRLTLDSIVGLKQTDWFDWGNLVESCDELYFVVAGASSDGRRFMDFRVAGADGDYENCGYGDRIHDVILFDQALEGGEKLIVFVAMLDEDDDELGWLPIFYALDGYTYVARDVLQKPRFFPDPDAHMNDAAEAVFAVMDSAGDDLVGGFWVEFGVSSSGRSVQGVDFHRDPPTTDENARNGETYSFTFLGNGARYDVTARIARPPYVGIQSINSRMCLNVPYAWTHAGANIQQYPCQGDANERFYLRPTDTYLTYQLVAEHSDKCIEVAGASRRSQANVQQGTCNRGRHQEWRLELLGDAFRLRNRHSGMCMNVAWASRSAHANVQQYPCGWAANERWTLLH